MKIIKSSPSISIVIPTYNRAKYLQRCLDSILSHKEECYEIIVSDNASPDDTQELMLKYSSDSRIQYFRNEKNLGFRENVYKATKYALGQYIFWLSDDDYLLPNALLKVVEVIKFNPNIGYIFTPFNTIDDRNGNVFCRYENFPHDVHLENSLETITKVLPATWVFSRQILKKDLIDWLVWEKFKENAYFMTIVVGRILLKSSAYYLNYDLIGHTWFNTTYWEEFGYDRLDISLRTEIDYKNTIKAVFFDQEKNKQITQIIHDWEIMSFKNFLKSPYGFLKLIRIKGIKESFRWIIREYGFNINMFSVFCLFIIRNKLIFSCKIVLKKIIRISKT